MKFCLLDAFYDTCPAEWVFALAELDGDVLFVEFCADRAGLAVFGEDVGLVVFYIDNFVYRGHEIGVFLGYPLTDIRGFICNEGRNCLCCGCWKVYSEPERAMKLFARYRKCTEAYARLFAAGFPLSRLTVQAHPA